MEVLHLTLKKKWFDMIASGEKKEEYREIKPYWYKRIVDSGLVRHERVEDGVLWWLIQVYRYKVFNQIYFRNGYSQNAPSLKVECKGIRIGEGREDWGAEAGKKYFVIELGEIIK